MSMVLSESELDRIREDAVGLLPAECDVLRATKVSDGGGGRRTTRAAAGSYPCRLAPLNRQAVDSFGGRVNENSSHIVTLPSDADVRGSDYLEIEGRVWAVTTIRDRTSMDRFVLRVEVMEVDGGS